MDYPYEVLVKVLVHSTTRAGTARRTPDDDIKKSKRPTVLVPGTRYEVPVLIGSNRC